MKNPPPKDKQRDKLYRAEDKTFIKDRNLSKECIERFVDKVVNSEWFKDKFKQSGRKLNLKLKFGRKNLTYSYQRSNCITIAQFQYTKRICCHEISHFLIRGGEHHGANFAACYLECVKEFLGINKHNKLKSEFIKNGVEF